MKFMFFAICVIALPSFYSDAQSDNHLVRGVVVDSMDGQPLEDATVVIKSLTSDIINATLRTNKVGQFKCELKPGAYLIITSYLDYLQDTTHELFQYFSSQRVLRIKLHRIGQTLDRVIVAAKVMPMEINHDTLTFNSSTFPNGGGANLEDFLQGLPGVEIDRDGNVTFQGKRITKIMIDGKEILLRDLRMLTKNLPVNMVASIQVFDSKTDEFSADNLFETEKETALNIRIKGSKKIGYTGNSYLSMGSYPNYAVGGSVIKLNSGDILLTGGSSNNINNCFEGKENWSGPAIPGRTFSHVAGLNLRRSLSKRLVGMLNIDGVGTKTDLTQVSNRQTFLGDSTLIQQLAINSSDKKFRNDFIASIQYKADSLTSITERLTGLVQSSTIRKHDTSQLFIQKMQDGDKLNNTRSSKGMDANIGNESSYSFSNYTNLTKRFSNFGGIMYFGFRYAIDASKGNGYLNTRITSFDSLNNVNGTYILNEMYKQKEFAHSYEASIEFDQPIGKTRILSVKYIRSSKNSDANKSSEDSSGTTGQYDSLDVLASNHFTNTNTSDHLGVDLISKIGTFNYEIGLETRVSSVKGRDFPTDTSILNRYTNLLPRVKVSQSRPHGIFWEVYYSLNTALPGIDQLRPITDLSNPYLIREGNLRLQQELDHHVELQFNCANSKTMDSWQINTHLNLHEHAISTATSILAGGVQKLQFVNVNGNYDFGAQIIHGIPLGMQSGNASIDIHSKWMHLTSILDENEGVNVTKTVGVLIKVNYHPFEKCFIYGKATVDLNSVVYSGLGMQNTNAVTQFYTLDASYEFPSSLAFMTYYTMTHASRLGNLPSQQSSYWNVSVFKSIFSNRSGQIHFSIFDIFNTENGLVQSSGLNYVSTTLSNNIGRFWLLSFVWTFHAFVK